MELPALIEALSNPAAYPHRPQDVQVRQTHISAVFLAGPYVYKIKKPVDFGFLDFSTLDRRQHFCEEEVRLNSRLAPGIYHGVVPVTRDQPGVHVESANGEIVEWAVKMDRLRDEDNLEYRILRDQVSVELVRELGLRVAAFHKSAERSARIAEFASFENVDSVVRENLAQAASQSAGTVSPQVMERVNHLTAQMMLAERTRIDDRASRGCPCDTHGDLRLEHIYIAPRREVEIAMIDCIEFSERYRYADPVADLAFLVMDFKFHDRRDLAIAFTDSYFSATGDVDGRDLLPLYVAYRAIVRSKVEALKASECEVPEMDRGDALDRVRAYWLLAQGELEQADCRPCLILVGGLPGTGKSSLAKQLAERHDFIVLRSDLIRKELAGVPLDIAAAAEFEQGIYAADWTERTYAECLRRAAGWLLEGKRVLVDASFGANLKRKEFFELAQRLCVPAMLLICRADSDVVRRRLAERRGDVSDADWSVYEQAVERWEPLALHARANVCTIETGGTPAETFEQAARVIGAMMRES